MLHCCAAGWSAQFHSISLGGCPVPSDAKERCSRPSGAAAECDVSRPLTAARAVLRPNAEMRPARDSSAFCPERPRSRSSVSELPPSSPTSKTRRARRSTPRRTSDDGLFWRCEEDSLGYPLPHLSALKQRGVKSSFRQHISKRSHEQFVGRLYRFESRHIREPKCIDDVLHLHFHRDVKRPKGFGIDRL